MDISRLETNRRGKQWKVDTETVRCLFLEIGTQHETKRRERLASTVSVNRRFE